MLFEVILYFYPAISEILGNKQAFYTENGF